MATPSRTTSATPPSASTFVPAPPPPPPFTLFAADITPIVKPFRAATLRARAARRIKNAKQIISDENKRLASLAVPRPVDMPTYMSVEAPPSVLPRKWWCDITGLKAPYKMPGNGMRYHDREVYEVIKHLPPGVDQQYLQLRSANVVLK
ncbi:uncharacterized protein V1518DRAFT_417796 [Limtongia smithiae]|uniref:uncharacterized protein n=1 Tax=Limtongia smithiae TaxID=1125753 RepID=UPI0034CEC954